MSDLGRRGCQLAAIGAVAALVALAGGPAAYGATHSVFVDVRDANSFMQGQLVRAGGRRVGKIVKVVPIDGGRRARIEMRVGDAVWPLTRGTKVSLRWGGTVSFLNRYIDIRPGASGAPAYPDGVTIPARDVEVPVEFDEVFGTFNKATRQTLESFLDTAGPALALTRRPLRRALREAPPAVTNASAVVRDLAAQEQALDTLVGSTAGVVSALDRADPEIASLISDAGTTLGATAAESERLGETLAQLPSTLASARMISRRATGTLSEADRLLTRIAPGVSALRRLPRPLNALLANLIAVELDGTAALARAAKDAPSITRLARDATALLPIVDGVATQADRALECIRPYTPEIAAFFSNWGDFISLVDAKDHVVRANIQAVVPALGATMPYTTATAVKAFPGLRYAFPRPPGYNADQPWFLPGCRAGRDALDPTKDPEARPFPVNQFLPPERKEQK